MKNKLQKHFPMIRTKGEALEAIKNNKKLWGIFCSWKEEYQQEYLQMQADIPRMIEGIEFFVPIASEQPEPGAAVYWVVNGAVYHSTDQCPSLSRSKNIQSGTVEEAAAAGKTRACPNCH